MLNDDKLQPRCSPRRHAATDMASLLDRIITIFGVGAEGVTLSPDHIGDDGQAIVALSSSCKTLHANEVLQKALTNIRLYRAISLVSYTRMPKALVGGAYDTLLSDVRQFKDTVRYLSGCGPRFNHVRDLLVQYRHLLAERREALRGLRGNERALALVRANSRSWFSWMYDNFVKIEYDYCLGAWVECTLEVYARGPLGKDVMYACNSAWGIDTSLDSDDPDMSSDSDGSDDEWLPVDA